MECHPKLQEFWKCGIGAPRLLSDMFTIKKIRSTSESKPREAFQCRMCDYVNDRMYHACKHYDRIHVNKGRAIPAKRKYVIEEADEENATTNQKEEQIIVSSETNKEEQHEEQQVELPSWW